MMALWMLYCALLALWLGIVASFVERVVLRANGPARAIWAATMLASLLLPAMAFVAAPRRTVTPTLTGSMSSAEARAASNSTVKESPVLDDSRPSWISGLIDRARPFAARTDKALIVSWAATSIFLLCNVAIGLMTVAVARRRWRRGVVDGVEVMISADTGPAVFGLVRSTIVVPDWILQLEGHEQSLILRHEIEHQRACDTLLLAFGRLVAIVMPWNPSVWWFLRRLRLAVEVDCDARVLETSSSDVALYGRLMLETVRLQRGMRLGGAALAGRTTELETRLRMMTRRGQSSRLATTIIASAGLIAIAAARAIPAPPKPLRTADSPATREVSEPKAPVSVTPSKRLVAGENAIAHPTRTKATNRSVPRKQLAPVAHPPEAPHLTESQPVNAKGPYCATSRLWASAVDTLGVRAVVRLLLSDADTVHRSVLQVISQYATGPGTALDYIPVGWDTPLIRCAIRGANWEIHLYGEGVPSGSIVVRTAQPTALVVATSSGETLVSMRIDDSERRYELRWPPIRR